MPRGGQESWRDRFLRETQNNKGKGGGNRPPAQLLPKAHKKLKNERPNYNV